MVLNSTKKCLLVFSALLLIGENTSFSSDNINSNDINKSEEYDYKSNIIKGKTHLKNRRSRSVDNKKIRHDNDMDNTLNRTFSQKGHNTFDLDYNVIDNEKDSMLNMTFGPVGDNKFDTNDNSESNNEKNLFNFTFRPKVNNEFDNQNDEYSNREVGIKYKNFDLKKPFIDYSTHVRHGEFDDNNSNREAGTKYKKSDLNRVRIIYNEEDIKKYNKKADLNRERTDYSTHVKHGEFDDGNSNREAGVKKYKKNSDLSKVRIIYNTEDKTENMTKDDENEIQFSNNNGLVSYKDKNPPSRFKKDNKDNSELPYSFSAPIYENNDNSESSYSYGSIFDNTEDKKENITKDDENEIQFSNNNGLVSYKNKNIPSRFKKDNRDNSESSYSFSASIYGNIDSNNEYLSYPGYNNKKK